MAHIENNQNEILDVSESLSFNHLHIEPNDNELPSDNFPELIVNLQMNRSCKIKIENRIISEIYELYFLYRFRCILTFHIEKERY